MTDLMARKSKRWPDLVRSRLRYRNRLRDQLAVERAAGATPRNPGKAAYLWGRLEDVTRELEEIETLLPSIEAKE